MHCNYSWLKITKNPGVGFRVSMLPTHVSYFPLNAILSRVSNVDKELGMQWPSSVTGLSRLHLLWG